MSRSWKWVLAILPQFLLLFGMCAREEWQRAHGRRVLLELAPVDPMDPLSGRYVALRTAIEQVDANAIAAAGMRVEAGSAIFARLEPEQGVWQAVQYAPAIPTGDGGLWIRGELRSERSDRVRIDFGLSRFYMPEDATDPSVLARSQPQALRLAVRVAPDGASAIEDLIVEGEPFAVWNARQAPERH